MNHSEERAETRAADLEREQSELRAAQASVAADLAREREATAIHQRRQADAEAQLESTRATVNELRRLVDQARQGEGREDAGANDELQADLERSREEIGRMKKLLAAAQKALVAVQSEMERERATNADLRQAAEHVDQQLASARSNEVQALADIEAMRKERDAAVGELRTAQQWIADHQHAEAEFTTSESSAAAAPATASKSKTHAGAKKYAGSGELKEEDWQTIRLSSRHTFRKPPTVQINGDPGSLCDLSVGGCQLLSTSALKPNQTVKVQLPAESGPVVCTGKVVWTRLEPAAKGKLLSYRAGVQFSKAPEADIDPFVVQQATQA
jgi:hypothetical protein